MEASGDCSSTIPDYSEDTFVTFTEEAEECYRQHENESFESYYSGEESEDTWQPLSQNDEEPDFSDPTVAAEDLIQKWINRLKDDSPSTPPAACVTKPGNGAALIKMTETPEEELEAVQSFCANKINWLSHLPSSVLSKRPHKCNNQKHGFTSEKLLVHEMKHIVPDQLVNRLHLKNFKETMKQLTEMKMHQPSQCPECEKKRAELAKYAFLRRKRTQMEEVLLQDKLEDHIYMKDALVLIGEIHQTLPKLSEGPEKIWQKLNENSANIDHGCAKTVKKV